MQSVVGVFTSCAAADKAVREMLQQGIPPQSLIFLTSEQLPQQVEQVPTTDTEAHGTRRCASLPRTVEAAADTRDCEFTCR